MPGMLTAPVPWHNRDRRVACFVCRVRVRMPLLLSAPAAKASGALWLLPLCPCVLVSLCLSSVHALDFGTNLVVLAMSKREPLLDHSAPANPLYPFPGESEEDANAREHEIAKLVRAQGG